MSKRYSQKQAAARVVRDQLAKERRKRIQLWTTLGAIMAIVVAGAAGYLIYNSQADKHYNTPSGTYADGLGFSVGTGPTLIEIYADYICPYCRSFETETKDTFDQWLAADKVQIVYYPVAILDDYSENEYSKRALAAAGCAADGGKFVEFNNALFADQPAENTAGPDNSELIATGKTVGLGDDFEKCVNDGTYLTWTDKANAALEARGLTGTPGVFVNGTQVDGTLEAVTAAVG